MFCLLCNSIPLILFLLLAIITLLFSTRVPSLFFQTFTIALFSTPPPLHSIHPTSPFTTYFFSHSLLILSSYSSSLFSTLHSTPLSLLSFCFLPYFKLFLFLLSLTPNPSSYSTPYPSSYSLISFSWFYFIPLPSNLYSISLSFLTFIFTAFIPSLFPSPPHPLH